MNKLVGIVIMFLVASVTLACADDFDEIIKACGRPDHDDSSLYDNPRPPIVSRIIDYDGSGVRFAFALDSLIGQEPTPPYSWMCIGAMTGPDKKEVLHPSQASEKLSSECARAYIRALARHATH